MERKGQGAIEYLLIIGAAILVVAIVIIAVTSILQQGQTQNTGAVSDQAKQANTLKCQGDINAMGFANSRTDCNSTRYSNTACACCQAANTDKTKLNNCKD